MKSLRMLCLVSALLAGPAVWAQQTVTIKTEGTPDSRIPIAIPDFCTAPGQEAMGREMARILSHDLEFSGIFTILPPERYPRDFAGFPRDASQIQFAPWRNTGAEFLVHAYVSLDATGIVAECRLFDVFAEQQVSGKRLVADGEKWQRLVVHQFADEVVLFLTGIPGIATTRICFSGGQTGKKEIYVADYDGANLTPVTAHEAISILPKFSPDGSSIAYMSYKDRYPFLYILDLRSGQSRPLSKEVGLNAAPAWAPGGDRLAMVLSKDANEEIYLVNPDGSDKRRLTRDPSLDTSPVFSPDGGQIAFVSHRGGVAQIHVMGADGSNPRRISYTGGRSYDPAWSPDGRMIACVVEKRGQGLQIYVINADGSDPRQLTASGGVNDAPTWAPDSRHVMFASTRGGRSELWTVTLSTNEQRRVPITNLSCQGPSWGPRRQ